MRKLAALVLTFATTSCLANVELPLETFSLTIAAVLIGAACIVLIILASGCIATAGHIRGRRW